MLGTKEIKFDYNNACKLKESFENIGVVEIIGIKFLWNHFSTFSKMEFVHFMVYLLFVSIISLNMIYNEFFRLMTT